MSAWCWNNGWLFEKGFRDYEGSGVVFMVGGCAAFWGGIYSGPRHGYERFRDHLKDQFVKKRVNTVNNGNTVKESGKY